MSEGRVRTEPGAPDVQWWKEAATRVRLSQAVLDQCADPVPGSALAADDAACPSSVRISDAARGVLAASLDNLAMWANTVAPKVFVEGVAVESAARPHFTVARAGIECAAQAGWLLEAEDSSTRIERHLRLALADMNEEQRAVRHVEEAIGTAVAQHIAELRAAASSDIKAAPAYLDMVRATAGHAALRPDAAEVLWRTASAAAHGKLWFVGATHITTIGEEVTAGRFRAIHEVNPGAISAVVTFASKLALWATCLFGQRLGLDVRVLYDQGLARLTRDLPRAVPDPDAL
jgi:hypothetical protein